MSMELTEADLTFTAPAQSKMSELFREVDEQIAGVRVYASGGGCRGVSFGMAFTDVIAESDAVRDFDAFKVVVDDNTLEHLRGVEIDFLDQGDGNATFVFNNLPAPAGGGCGGGCNSDSGGHSGGCH